MELGELCAHSRWWRLNVFKVMAQGQPPFKRPMHCSAVANRRSLALPFEASSDLLIGRTSGDAHRPEGRTSRRNRPRPLLETLVAFLNGRHGEEIVSRFPCV